MFRSTTSCGPQMKEEDSMSNFEDACKEYGIALYVIPPRTPELNGNVEPYVMSFINPIKVY